MANQMSGVEGRKDRRGSIDPPRFNIISFLLLIAGTGLGTAIGVLRNHPWAIVVGSIVGCIAAVAPRSPSNGSGRLFCAWAITSACAALGSSGSFPGLTETLPGSISGSSPPVSPPSDAHRGHRAGERRRRFVLDGLRPREGGARGAGLQAGGQLGGETALRDIIGRTPLTVLLRGREQIEGSSRSSSMSGPTPGASRSNPSRCAT